MSYTFRGEGGGWGVSDSVVSAVDAVLTSVVYITCMLAEWLIKIEKRLPQAIH